MRTKAILLVLLIINIHTYGSVRIIGKGATYPAIYYNELFKNYPDSEVTIHYKGIGSGQGYLALKNNQTHFAGSDLIINKTLQKHLNTAILQIPSTFSAIAICYQLENIPTLNLTSELLSKIFRGKIRYWDHPLIKKINPHTNLPHIKIIPIYRKNNSGSTFIFSHYLSESDSQWNSQMGTKAKHDFPVGLGSNDSQESIDLLHQIQGGITYVGLDYTKKQNTYTANIKNNHGNYIKPTRDALEKSFEDKDIMDSKLILTNAKQPTAYPITSFSWIILKQNLSSKEMSKKEAIELKKLLLWLINDEKTKTLLGYKRLPKNVRKNALKQLETLTYNKKPIK
ncbi:MAG: phosphate ABC transporter substrate-binding protein PstS [bacterium]